MLQRRGLEAPFAEFLLTSVQGMVLLFAILDLPQVKRLEAYTTPELLHHLSTDLQGLPVFLSNSNGLRYAIPLSPLPRLPKLVPFPGIERGWALLGVNQAGETVSEKWPKLGHLLVAGKTGSGNRCSYAHWFTRRWPKARSSCWWIWMAPPSRCWLTIRP